MFAYDPVEKVMIEADIAPAEEWQWWADAYLQNLEHYGLEVDTVVSNHFGIMTHEEMVEFPGPGRRRAQEHCVRQAEIGHFVAGCPPFFLRGGMIDEISEWFSPAFE